MSLYSMSLVLALVMAAASQTAAQSPLSDWMPGVATNYGGPSEGMDPNTPSYGLSNGGCGYGDLSNRGSYPFYSAVGIPPGTGIGSLPTGGCGTCIEFQCVNDRTPSFAGRCGGGGATVTVTVTDTCPECAAPTDGQGDHFDLNALSFNQIAPMLNGRIDVNYRLVACTPPSALQVQVDGNDGPGLWLRLLITTVADLGTISAVNIQGAGASTWSAMTNTYGAAWEVSNQPAYPISLEVTSGSQTVSMTNVLTTPTMGTFQTTQQFSASGSPTTTTPTSSSTTPTSSSSSSSTTTSSTSSSSPSASPSPSSPGSSPSPSSPESNPSSPGSSPSPSSPESSPSSPGSSPSFSSPESSPSSPGSSPSPSSPETSPSSSSPGSSPSTASGNCADELPQGSTYSCSEQAGYGQCGASWMAGFCKLSCGTC